MDLVQILREQQVVSEEDVPALQAEVTSSDQPIENTLLEHGIAIEDILRAKGEYFGLPTRTISPGSIGDDVVGLIPEKTVEQYRIVPLGLVDNVLEVGMVDPDNLEARDMIRFVASKQGVPYKLFVVSEKEFLDFLGGEGGLSGEVSQALSELETELSSEEQEVSKEIERISKESPPDSDEKHESIVESAPVTRIVATILQYATEGRASDIHIEPIDKSIRVRFRVDGELNTSLKLPKTVLGAVVARIKILANLKLDERRKPQDGRFSAHINNRKIDFRVSTFPTYYGEKVVMRILDTEGGVIKLDNMGMTKKNLNLIREAIKRPYGLILISGPTGSGKTTTLYSMLNELDRDKKNVLSLEDPVEYNIPGMNQSQIRPEIGYTFANGLRTTLRQDPDIIMVGEIRDKETAALAIQAALTGHLVLSTIHTNNAVGVIPRLIDMGVDPYLIAPTLILAIAQRLVRRLCDGAGKPVPIEGSIKTMIDKQFEDLPEKYRNEISIPKEIYTAQPTPECATGLRGRMAVFEILPVDKSLEQVILSEPSEITIARTAREKGMLMLKEDGLLKAFKGVVPLEEVNKL